MKYFNDNDSVIEDNQLSGIWNIEELSVDIR